MSLTSSGAVLTYICMRQTWEIIQKKSTVTYNGIKESLQFPRDKNCINANDTTYSRYKLQ